MKITETKIDGDFRSHHCTEILNEVDIVVTNPPFSLFREFFKWLMDNNKDFIIVGNQNAINDIDIFPYLQTGEVKIGSQTGCKKMEFVDANNGDVLKPFGNICWYTTVDLQKHHDPLLLTEKYSIDRYPKYDNYDAIEVSKVNWIPCDYYGVMGVPITFLYVYDQEQFEIIGNTSNSTQSKEAGIPQIGEEAINDYFANGGTGHYTANMYRLVLRKGNKVNFPYGRLLIKRRTN